MHDCPKVGVVDQKWAQPGKFCARFACIYYIDFQLCPGLFSGKLGNYAIHNSQLIQQAQEHT